MADPVNALHTYGLHEKTLRQSAQVSSLWSPFRSPVVAQPTLLHFLQSDPQQARFLTSEVWGTVPRSVDNPPNRPDTWTDPVPPRRAESVVWSSELLRRERPANRPETWTEPPPGRAPEGGFWRPFFAPVAVDPTRPRFVATSAPQTLPWVDESGTWAPTFLQVDNTPNRPQTFTEPQPFQAPGPLVWRAFFEPPVQPVTRPHFLVGDFSPTYPARESSITRYFAGAAPLGPTPRFVGTDPQVGLLPEASTRPFYHPEATRPHFLVGERAWQDVRESVVWKQQPAAALPPEDPPLRPLFYVDPQADLRPREAWTYHQPPESVAPPPPAPDLGSHGGWLVKPPSKRRAPAKSLQQEMDELLESLGTVGSAAPDSPAERRVVAKASRELIRALQSKRPAEDDDEDDDILLLS